MNWNLETPVGDFTPHAARAEMRRLAFQLDSLKFTDMDTYKTMSRTVEIRMHQLRKRADYEG